MAQLDGFLRVNLRPRHLHLLVALDDFRNVAKAAASLNVTQPAVSKALADLERGLGIKLFERHARGLNPTPYGECLIRHARILLTDLTHARDELRGLVSGTAGTVHLGVSQSTAVHSFLPQGLAMLRKRLPNATVLVNEGTLSTLLPELWSGRLDLIVGRLPNRRAAPALQKKIFSEVPVTLVAGASHPLAGRARLRWSDLNGFPWVMPPIGTVLRGPIEQALESHGLSVPVNCIETLSVHLICSYLQLSDALAFVAKDVSNHYQRLGLIAVLPLALPQVMRPVGIVWIKRGSLPPIAPALIDCLEQAEKLCRQTSEPVNKTRPAGVLAPVRAIAAPNRRKNTLAWLGMERRKKVG